MISYYFSFLMPFLFIVLFLQEIARHIGLRVKGRMITVGLAAVSALMGVIPVSGLPIGRWIISLNANFSIPLLTIVFSRILHMALGSRLLDHKALDTCALFSIVSGVILYPMALGFGSWDPYASGWGFSWLFVGVLGCTVLLVILKNRFSTVLVAAILAYNLRVLESVNFWDYLVDPLVVLWAVIWLGRSYLFGARVHRRKTVPSTPKI